MRELVGTKACGRNEGFIVGRRRGKLVAQGGLGHVRGGSLPDSLNLAKSGINPGFRKECQAPNPTGPISPRLRASHAFPRAFAGEFPIWA